LQLSGGVGPDGIALDSQGNPAVCHFGLGTVWLFSPLGEPIARIRSCEGLNTNDPWVIIYGSLV
jgi:gluconolactonase